MSTSALRWGRGKNFCLEGLGGGVWGERETKKFFNVFVGLTRNMKLEVTATCSDRYQCKVIMEPKHVLAEPQVEKMLQILRKRKERTAHASVSLSLHQCLRITTNR